MMQIVKKEISKKKTKKIVSRLLRGYSGNIKLNIGCGTDYKEGWINIDNNSDSNIDKLDLNWDLRKPLPFADNSVDYVYNEHFIEHLTVEEGQIAIRDLHRVLKKGGVMRIATPDLSVAVDKYLNLPLNKDPVIKKFKLGFIETKAERINIAFRWWGHKWLYDWEELRRRLKEAGCSNIKRATIGTSKHEDLCGLETRQESTLIAEVTK